MCYLCRRSEVLPMSSVAHAHIGGEATFPKLAAFTEQKPGGSLLGLLEISQIRRRLVLLGGHQIAVRAQHIALVADVDELLTLGAYILDPDRPRICVAAVGLVHRPRTPQSTIDHCDVVMQEIR